MNRRGFLGLLAGAALGAATGMGLRASKVKVLWCEADVAQKVTYTTPHGSAFTEFFEATKARTFTSAESMMREYEERQKLFRTLLDRSSDETRRRLLDEAGRNISPC